MQPALQALAALAPTLKEAELRCVLELIHRADQNNVALASSRSIAQATGLSRKNVQLAIDSLSERGLIATDSGSATVASSHRLAFLEVEVLPGGGVNTTPPAAQQWRFFDATPGAVSTPGVASENGQGGVNTTPPILRARESIDLDSERAIDRLLKAKPSKYDPAKLMIARQWLHGYMAKFGRMPDPHPPDEQICAQFLSIAEWPRLEGLLYDLMAERREAGDKYGWFIVVALQRIWGISAQRQREVRAQLKLVSKAEADDDLAGQIAAAAHRKAMR